MPQPAADIDAYVVYIGFDPASLGARKEKARRQGQAGRQAKIRTPKQS